MHWWVLAFEKNLKLFSFNFNIFFERLSQWGKLWGIYVNPSFVSTTLTRECTRVCLLHVCKCSHCLGFFSRISPSFSWHSSFTQGSVCCVHRSTQSPRCHFTDTILSHNTRIHRVSSVVIINMPRAEETQDLTSAVHLFQDLLFLWIWPWQEFSLWIIYAVFFLFVACVLGIFFIINISLSYFDLISDKVRYVF